MAVDTIERRFLQKFKPGDNIQYLKTPDEIKGLTIRDHGDCDYVVYRPIAKPAPSLRMGETHTAKIWLAHLEVNLV